MQAARGECLARDLSPSQLEESYFAGRTLSVRDCDFCSVFERIFLTDAPPCCGPVRDFNAAGKMSLNCILFHCRAKAAACCSRTLTFSFFKPSPIGYITRHCTAKLGPRLENMNYAHDRHNLAEAMMESLAWQTSWKLCIPYFQHFSPSFSLCFCT